MSVALHEQQSATSSRGHLIGPSWREGEGTLFHSTDPATGRTVWEGRPATTREVDAAVHAGRAAWTSPAQVRILPRVPLFGAQATEDRHRTFNPAW